MSQSWDARGAPEPPESPSNATAPKNRPKILGILRKAITAPGSKQPVTIQEETGGVVGTDPSSTASASLEPTMFNATSSVTINGGTFNMMSGTQSRPRSDPDTITAARYEPWETVPVNLSSAAPRGDDIFRSERTPRIRKDSQIYHDSLLEKGRGSPLWTPGPNLNLSIEYRRTGTKIGDVGIIKGDGAFSFLFNILHPADHPINRGKVPSTFVPLLVDLSDDIEKSFVADTYIASKSVTKSSAFEENGLAFQSSAAEGAILTTPGGAYSTNFENRTVFEDYAKDHLESWYEYANGPRGRQARNGDIRLVYGTDKVTSWGMATFSSQEEREVRLEFRKVKSTGSYTWNCHGPGASRVGPGPVEHEDLIDTTSGSQKIINQSVFIRTIHMKLSEAVWKEKFGHTVFIHDEDGVYGEQHEGQGSTDTGPRKVAPSIERRPTEKQIQGGKVFTVKVGEVHDAISHPSDAINEIMLFLMPNAQAAISDDADWLLICEEIPQLKNISTSSDSKDIPIDLLLKFLTQRLLFRNGAVLLNNNRRKCLKPYRPLAEATATSSPEFLSSTIRGSTGKDSVPQSQHGDPMPKKSAVVNVDGGSNSEDGNGESTSRKVTDQERQEQEQNNVDAPTYDPPPTIEEFPAGLRHEYYTPKLHVEDFELAVSHQKEAVKLSPSDHLNRPNMLNNLGSLYSDLYERMGNLDDLALSIKNTVNSVETAHVNHTDLAGMLNVGISYSKLFGRAINVKDLSLAISYQQNAVDATRPGDPDLSSRLNSLGTLCSDRLGITGDLNDLDLSISNQQKAVDATLPDHPSRPGMLNNLGNWYCIRFQQTGDPKDLGSAISNHQEAVESAGVDYHDFPQLLGNLAIDYSKRFSVTNDFNDLALVISNHQKALDTTRSNEQKLELLNNLADDYCRLFIGTGNLDHLGLAISNQQDAIDLTPPEHPCRPDFLSKLGNFFMSRFSLTGKKEDATAAITLFRQGAFENGAPSKRFKSAQAAAEQALKHEASKCMDDCSSAMDLLSHLVGFDQILLHRRRHLREASTFTTFAVAAALSFESIDLALKWLEQGRCLVWYQITQLRSSFDVFRNQHRELADQLNEVANALDTACSRSPSQLVSDISIKDETSLHDAAARHSSLARRYDSILASIREKDGFADFLLPGNFETLVSSLPPDGPVVVLNLHSSRRLSRCDALILERGKDTLLVPLKSITISRVQTMARNLHERLRDGLREEEVEDDSERGTKPGGQKKPTDLLVMLWEDVVEPIFKALGYFDSPIPLLADRPRLWWCPTGPFMFLPIHAAHAPSSGGKALSSKSVADFVISSYTPTISTLIAKYNTALTVTDKRTGVAVISQPYAPGFGPIPATVKEVQTVARLMDYASIPRDLLEDRDATIDAVKERMATRSWLHFACHGIQDEKDPLSSGLALQDGLLKLSNIVNEHPPNTDFAFLSACQTGKGVADLSDEAVHIAAGMLAIGFNSVIGTMWSISDLHGPKFAEYVYEYLIFDKGKTGKLDSSKAAHALDYATRKFRKQYGYGKVSSEWVPYVHFGY